MNVCSFLATFRGVTGFVSVKVKIVITLFRDINRGKEVIEMAKDPVCKMEVDEKTAAATSEYKGKTYYFCAVGCKKAFDADPEKYLPE